VRALAEYAVRGRSQAVTVAAIAAALPLLFWISAATIALVTLRKGWQEGLYILLWSVLPAAVWVIFRHDPTPLMVLLGTTALAIVLRQTVSWVYTLMTGVVIGILVSGIMSQLVPELIAELVKASEAVLANVREQLAPELQAQLSEALAYVLSGFFGTIHLLMMVACLILARWWQSTLFNPGGFRAEFHQLRLPRAVALPLLLVVLIGGNVHLALLTWAPVMTVPLFIAGLALVHGLLGRSGSGQPLLVVFYFGLLFVEPYFYLLLIFVAGLDSWLDFRAKAARADDE